MTAGQESSRTFDWITMSIPIHKESEVGVPGEKPAGDVMKLTILGIPPGTDPKSTCKSVMKGIELGLIKVEPGPRSIAFHEIEDLEEVKEGS